jgi:hypothetical protein
MFDIAEKAWKDSCRNAIFPPAFAGRALQGPIHPLSSDLQHQGGKLKRTMISESTSIFYPQALRGE